MKIKNHISIILAIISLTSPLFAQATKTKPVKEDNQKEKVVNRLQEIDKRATAPIGVSLKLMSEDPTYGYRD